MAESGSGTGRASGKVILLGEHAVVYGSPAIAVALERGARAEARAAQRSCLTLGGETHSDGAAPEVARAFGALLAELGAQNIEAEAHLDIPAGAGLGASAALGVALCRAVLAAVAPGSTAGSVTRAALMWENVFHGNASGIDTAAAEHGGCIWFTRASGAARLRAGAPLRIAVAVVEPGASTRAMVEGVSARRKADPEGVDRRMRSIAELVERGREALAAGHISSLGPLMNDNHALLRELGVSTPGLDLACQSALAAGAIGAKLTGAGGGGAAIALVDDDSVDSVRSAWADHGFHCLEARASD